MKANGFGQRQLSEDSGNNRKKQLARSDATCSEDPPRPATTGRPPPVFSPSEPQWYTDKTGVNLIQFIRNTLHKNPKDREMMLLFERDMRAFIQDTEKRALRFPRMSSYNRMLIHRAAAFFGLDHNIDNSASCVICTKTPKTRIPEVEFKTLIMDNVYTDHVMRNQYPRRSAQSFDESYPRGNRRQYRNAHSNSLDLTRRGNSFEVENPPYISQTPTIAEAYATGPPTAIPGGYPMVNISYQPIPYAGPPICAPYACKESLLQEHLNDNHKSEDGNEPNRRTTSSTTTTITSEESEPPHYINPIYDPAHFTSLHAQAVTYHAMPGVPVGYVVVQDNNVKLVAQADVSNLSNQFNSLQISNPPFSPLSQPPTMQYNTATPPTYLPSGASQPIPYANLDGSYSTPRGNIAYAVAAPPESPGVFYATNCGIPYATPPTDQSLGMQQQYPGYLNPMYLPMYTMLPNVVPAQQYPPSSSQYTASMPGPSGSNTN